MQEDLIGAYRRAGMLERLLLISDSIMDMDNTFLNQQRAFPRYPGEERLTFNNLQAVRDTRKWKAVRFPQRNKLTRYFRCQACDNHKPTSVQWMNGR